MTVRILKGDCRETLRALPDGSVHCVTTSPPYWGLRSYGVEPTLWGGDIACEHEWGAPVRKHNATSIQGPGSRGKNVDYAGYDKEKFTGPFCTKCGCWRGDLGLEPTPELFIDHMLEVFREVWRVLRDDGTLWLNIGDCYASGGGAGVQGRGGDRFERAHTQKYLGVNKGGRRDPANTGKHRTKKGSNRAQRGDGNGGIPFAPEEQPNRAPIAGLKPKDLVGIPWMLAFALRADGWYLRMDNVWQKPNPMPESIEDRTTKSHEYLFHLTKSADYYYDAEAIKEQASENSHARKAQDGNGPQGVTPKSYEHRKGVKANTSFHAACSDLVEKRNKRSVWTVATQPFPEAHFATFPPALIEPCILAGTSERGCCPTCKAGWVRVTAPTERYAKFLGRGFTDHEGDATQGMMQSRGVNRQNAMINEGGIRSKETETIGWYPDCGCLGRPKLPAYPPNPRRDDAETDERHEEALDQWRRKCRFVDAARRELCAAVAGEPTVPAVVLDPFGGAGTTGLVADRLQRDAVLCELNPEYADMAVRRLQGDGGLFSKVAAE